MRKEGPGRGGVPKEEIGEPDYDGMILRESAGQGQDMGISYINPPLLPWPFGPHVCSRINITDYTHTLRLKIPWICLTKLLAVAALLPVMLHGPKRSRSQSYR